MKIPDGLFPSHVAHRDTFLVKLSKADGSLAYGAHLGGDHSDQADAMVIADGFDNGNSRAGRTEPDPVVL